VKRRPEGAIALRSPILFRYLAEDFAVLILHKPRVRLERGKRNVLH
jgi:hypothetical protein